MKEIAEYFAAEARRKERSVRRLTLAIRVLAAASVLCLLTLAALAMRIA